MRHPLIPVLLAVFLLPIIILNACGDIAAVIWLICLGQWGVLVIGLCSIILGSLFIPFVLLPGSLLAVTVCGSFAQRGNRSMPVVAVALSQLWITAAITTWASLALYFSMFMETRCGFLLVCLVGYGVATTPWVYLAQRDSQFDHASRSFIHVLFLSAGYIIGMCAVWFGDVDMWSCIGIFATAMAVSWILQLVLLIVESNAENQEPTQRRLAQFAQRQWRVPGVRRPGRGRGGAFSGQPAGGGGGDSGRPERGTGVGGVSEPNGGPEGKVLQGGEGSVRLRKDQHGR